MRGVRASAGEYMRVAGDARSVRLVGTSADHFAAMWRALPAGQQMRCHGPPFGLRFYARGTLVCQASICWRCNNIFGDTRSDRLFFAFDGSAPRSRDLLRACEHALGASAAE